MTQTIRCDGDCEHCKYDDCIGTPPFSETEYFKHRYTENVDNGICTLCRKAPADEGYTTCAECRRKGKETYDKRRRTRIENHRCVYCNKPLEDDDARYCKTCKEAFNKGERPKRYCPECGAVLEKKKHFCAECRERHRQESDAKDLYRRKNPRRCLNCGAEVEGKAWYCAKCKELDPYARRTMPRKCPDCGKELQPRKRYCDDCRDRRYLETQRKSQRKIRQREKEKKA